MKLKEKVGEAEKINNCREALSNFAFMTLFIIPFVSVFLVK